MSRDPPCVCIYGSRSGAAIILPLSMSQHMYAGGICRCLGVSSPHNELEQVCVYSREGQLLDYYKDISEYFQYNPHKRDRDIDRVIREPAVLLSAPQATAAAFDPVEARKDFSAKHRARMALRGSGEGELKK